MNLTYKKAESLNQPLEIDGTLSPNGVYIRRNIEAVTYTDSNNEEKTKYSYEECFLTKNEYEKYSLATQVVALVELKRESEIIDSYTLELIEGGVL